MNNQSTTNQQEKPSQSHELHTALAPSSSFHTSLTPLSTDTSISYAGLDFSPAGHVALFGNGGQLSGEAVLAAVSIGSDEWALTSSSAFAGGGPQWRL